MIPASYGHLADHRRGHRAPSYFVRMVFPFALAGTKNRVIGFPQKKPKICVGRWCSVNTRFAWAGGTFFPVVLLYCVSFWFWREIGFGCTHYYVLGVPYSCGVVLVFLSSVWRVRYHYYDRKKKLQSSVWRVRNHYYDRKKKDTVVCLAGARSLLRPEKKVLVVIFTQN